MTGALALSFPDDSHDIWSRHRAAYPHNANSNSDLGSWSRDMAGVISRKLSNRLTALQSDTPNHLPQNSIQSFQNVSPSSPTEDGADMDPTSKGTNTDLLGGMRERVPSRRDARDLIKVAFTNALPKHRVTAKEIADEIGAAENTVEGWRSDGVMSAEFLMIVQVRYPQFEGELRRLFKLQRELSPDFAREFAAMLQRVL